MRKSLKDIISRALVLLRRTAPALLLVISSGMSVDSRSFNVGRIRLAELTSGSKNGYICGYDKYVYVSRGEQFSIVDVATGGIKGPYDPHVLEDPDPVLGHGKACAWAGGGGAPRIHLILPNYSRSDDDASIYILDVTDWEEPVLKGRIQDIQKLHEGRLYSAFVSTIEYQNGPVWVFAAAPANAFIPIRKTAMTLYIFST